MASPHLRLKIKTDGQEYRADVGSGKKLTIGRSDQADIILSDASVSLEHFEVSWNGLEVFIRDLKSSNGTFRMPQDAPFVEATFAARFENLQFRLGQVNLSLSWQPFVVTLPSGGKTVVSAVPRSPVTGEKTSVSYVPQAPAPTETVPVSYAIPVGPPPPAIRVVVERPFNARENGAWMAMLGVEFVFLCVAIFANRWFLGGIDAASSQKLLHGGAVDGMLEWMRFLRDHPWAVILGAVAYGTLMGITWSWLSGRELSFPTYMAKHLRIPTGLIRMCALALSLAVLLWPMLWAFLNGVTPSQLAQINHLFSILTSEDRHDRPVRSEQLKAMNEKFPGSSFLYQELFDNQMHRVLQDCGGVGDAPWEKKKICLILLVAVGIETYREVQPALLQEIASRAAILLSLDGITRVGAVEGISSSTIPFFLNSLELIGLKKEQEDISKILYDPNQRPAEIINHLRDLRRRIEKRIDVRNHELHFPNDLILNVPGPLESGI